MEIILEPFAFQDIDMSKCMGRQKNFPNKQCIRKGKYNGICGWCKKRADANKLVLISEKYINERIKKCSKVNKCILLDIKLFNPITKNKLINKKNLLFTLKYYKIICNSTEKKDLLVNKLLHFYKRFFKYQGDLNKIISLQRKIRVILKEKHTQIKGPGYKNRKLCVNATDFYTFDDLNDIPDKYFFSYKNNFTIYGFDIRSFIKLLEITNKNPYDNTLIPKSIINKSKQLYDNIKNSIVEIKNDYVLTAQQKLNHEMIRVFQLYDDLNYYTDIDWLLDLNIIKLRKFYNEARDIWVWRAGLTNESRRNIVTNGRAFELSKYQLYKLKLNNLRKEILREMERFATQGKTKSDKVLGALFMMTCLTMVSKKAALGNSHLLQVSAFG